MNAAQLRKTPEHLIEKMAVRRPLYIIGDNLFDTFNISGLFRLADALCAKELILCGVSETPPNPKIIKYTVGTHKVVPWRRFDSISKAISDLREEEPNLLVVSLEQTKNSIEYTYFNPPEDKVIAIIAGNESKGISKEALELSDYHLEIPMFGLNNSLNVVVATSIVGYYLASIT